MASSLKLPNLPDASGEDLSATSPDADHSGDANLPSGPSVVADEVKTFIYEVDAARLPGADTVRLGGDESLPHAKTDAGTSLRRTDAPDGRETALPGPVQKRNDGPEVPAPLSSDRRSPASSASDASPAPAVPTKSRTRSQSAARPKQRAAARSGDFTTHDATTSRSLHTESAQPGEHQPIRVNRQSPATRQGKRRGKIPSWVVSLVTHGLLLVILSFATLATVQTPEDFDLLASPEVTEEIEQFTDVELDAETLDEFADELPAELLDPGAATASEFAAEAALADVANELGPAATGDLADLGALFDEAGSGQGILDEGLGAGGAATFFGDEIQGNRIVFLVDNSGGMQHGGLEALSSELKQCVRQLRPQQRFYVIFYSDTIYPLFYPEPASNFIRPTPQNLKLLGEWLDSVEVCLGNAIDEALAATTAIEPDVVYLLTDGRVNTTRDGRKLNMFLAAQGRRFTIHTLGMGTGEAGDAADQLRQIADANGGKFRAVEIEPADRDAAKARQRPYHNRQPGTLWGRNVKPPR